MNIHDIETLLIGMVVSTLILTLFIYLGNLILNFPKISDPSRSKKGNQNFKAKTSKSENLRKKIELNPAIICSLPIYQAGRPEAPLS